MENLPGQAAIVVGLDFAGSDTRLLDALAIVILSARDCLSVIYAAFLETNFTVSLRFTSYAAQVVAMLWMATVAVRAAFWTRITLPNPFVNGYSAGASGSSKSASSVASFSALI